MLVHEIDLAVVPRPAGTHAIRNGIRQQYPVRKDMVCAEVSFHRRKGISEAGSLHLAAVISARRDVRVIHDAVIEGLIRKYQHVVRVQLRVSAVETVVSVSCPVLPSVDRPVPTDADLVKLTGPNIRGLLCREARAEVMLERQRVGAGRAVCLEHLDEAIDRLNALGVVPGHAEDLIHSGAQIGCGGGKCSLTNLSCQSFYVARDRLRLLL